MKGETGEQKSSLILRIHSVRKGWLVLKALMASLEFLGCSLEHLQILHTELLPSAQLDCCFFALSGPLPLLSSLISQSVSCRISIQPYKRELRRPATIEFEVSSLQHFEMLLVRNGTCWCAQESHSLWHPHLFHLN